MKNQAGSRQTEGQTEGDRRSDGPRSDTESLALSSNHSGNRRMRSRHLNPGTDAGEWNTGVTTVYS